MARIVRTGILLIAAALLLAGCVNSKPAPSTTTPPAGQSPPADVLAPVPALPLSLKIDGPTWVEPGTPIPVTATSTTGGTLTFTWATGQLPGTVAASGAPLNTSLIEPGSTKTLVFTRAGLYNMHCHPHPFMRSNVTVIDGYKGPDLVDVQIQDGATTSDYRFVPENIVVGPGTKVVYHDVGKLAHTSTELQRTPPLAKAALSTRSGALDLPASIAMPGMDMQMAPEWTNVVVVAQDAQGRVGIANASIYINSFPLPYNTTLQGNFAASGLPESAVAPAKKGFLLDEPGTLYLNFSAVDAASKTNPTLPNQATIDIHVKGNGETQDVVTVTGKASGASTARINPGSYSITVAPNAGTNVDYNVFVTILYDHIPPKPVLGGGGAEHQH